MELDSNTAARLDNAAQKNTLVYGVSYIDLLEGRKWQLAQRMWQDEIYKAVNPFDVQNNPSLPRTLTIMKPTQVGMSTMGVIKNLHFLDYWNVRTMYTLPRQQDVTDMVSTRVEPMIAKSPRLSKKLGKPDSSRVKRIGDSYMFFMELSVEPRMMPADALYIDEVDLSDSVNLETALNRLDNSPWQLKYYFSTPTLSNFGIHSLYLQSDAREWFVKCPSCGKWQVLDWYQNLRIKGPEREPTSVHYGCTGCDHFFTQEDIQSGRWVAEFPSRSSTHLGYHVSQLMTHTPEWLYSKFIDPKTTLVEFYRKRLGKPYEIGSGSLSREDFLVYAFPHDGGYFNLELVADNNPDNQYFMGVDQGNNLQVVVVKKNKHENFARIVWSEIVDFETGFSRLTELMYNYRVSRCVIDADPNRHDAHTFQSKFVGKVFVADYSSKIDRRWKIRLNPKTGVKEGVVIHRTEEFDALLTSIVNAEWQLAGEPPSRIEQRVEKIISHVTALRRDIIKVKTTSGEEDVAIYRSVGPDHLAHSLAYVHVAMEIENGASTFRMRVIGAEPIPESGKKEGKVDKEKRKVIRLR